MVDKISTNMFNLILRWICYTIVRIIYFLINEVKNKKILNASVLTCIIAQECDSSTHMIYILLEHKAYIYIVGIYSYNIKT